MKNNLNLILIKGSIRIKQNGGGIMNSFSLACKNGDLKEVVRLYKSAKIYLFEICEGKNTAMHFAVQNNHKEIVRFLINENIFMNIKNENGETPLLLAFKNENEAIIKLFSEYYADSYMSAVLNSSTISEESKEKISNLYDHDDDCIMEDLVDQNVVINELNYEDLIYLFEYYTQEENWENVKKILSVLYKNYNKDINSNIGYIITEITLTENQDMISFVKNVFNVKELKLKADLLGKMFLAGTINSIKLLHDNFHGVNLSDTKVYANRGSLDLLKFMKLFYNIDYSDFPQTDLLKANSEPEYFNFIKNELNINNNKLFEIITNLVMENNEFSNHFISEVLNKNQDLVLFKDLNGESILFKMIKYENKECIKFIANHHDYLLNDFNNSNETPLIYTAKNNSVEIFNILLSCEKTNIHLFNKNMDNVLHILLKEDLSEREEKFKSLISHIDNDLLLFTNKEGKTPLYIICELNKIEELKQLISNGIVNDDNINYPSLGRVVGDFYKLNVLNVKQSIDGKYKKVMTPSNVEDGILQNNLVYLSKALYEIDMKKARMTHTSFNSFMNKAQSFECVLLMANYNFDINGINPEEVETPLMLAIERNDLPCAIYLINKNCEINTQIEDGINSLVMAYNKGMSPVICLLLKNKIEVENEFLSESSYSEWMSFAEIPNEKIKPIDFNKENIKKGIFGKNEKMKYKINKTDSEIVILIKNILNIIDDSRSFEILINHCKINDIEVVPYFIKNKFADLFFYKGDKKLNLNQLGLSRAEIKEKLNYNYFELKRIVKGK